MAKVPKPPRRAGLSGVLVVDKPQGPTSFEVVAEVRRRYRVRSVGHAGTLDPMATGVLVVMLGEATKLSDYLTVASKRYLAEVSFGRSTDTLDADGQTVEERPVGPGHPSASAVACALEHERQRTWQVPPAFSAIKQGGETAYKRARRGETVELPARPVLVHTLAAGSIDGARLQLELHVSKGYYVRSLARDLCDTLGLPGCLSALRRTSSGAFGLEHAKAWTDLESTPPLLTTADAARLALPCGNLTDEGVLFARQGKRLTSDHFSELPHESPSAWFSPTGELVAIGERRPPQPEPVDTNHEPSNTAASVAATSTLAAFPAETLGGADPLTTEPTEAPSTRATSTTEFRVLRGFMSSPPTPGA